MTITDLFQKWNTLRDALANPHLPEDEVDRLARESMGVIRSLTRTTASGLGEVLLKLEIYSREIEAGPCIECDALLGSVLQDRVALLGRLGQMGMPAAAPVPLEHLILDDDIAALASRRSQGLGSPHP